MTSTNSAVQTPSTAAPHPEEATPISRDLLGKITAEFSGLGRGHIEEQCRSLNRDSSGSMIELGTRLLFLKETTQRGEWLITLQRIGISPGIALKTMSVVKRLLILLTNNERKLLVAATSNKSQLVELMVLDDYELVCLASGEAVRGVSLTTLPETSVSTLRGMLKNNGLKAASETCSHGFRDDAPMIPQAAEGNITPAVPPTAEPIIASLEDQTTADTTSLLQAGDQVQSLHAGRPGRVVRTYADGSACVCWDDGEPQAEGLGHERMPRQLLVRVSQEEAGEDAGKASITREEAELIRTALMASLRKNDTKRLLSVEEIVDTMRANRMIQPGEVSAVFIATIIRDLHFYGLHPDQLLTKEPVETELGGGAMNTTAPFSGCIDPGNDLHVGHRPAVPDQAANLQALPSVYSMTHGDFAGIDVTLMIHAGKSWMIAEEIAAVLGDIPEQVAEIEEIIGQHFTAARIPEAYAKVRIASTALTARLLDAYAIHLLDVVLDTPASSALFAWMDGLAKTYDAAEASPLPTNDESTLSQNFSQLEVLHGIAWNRMDQLASQIGALRVVLMEQYSDPGSVVKAIVPETLAEVAANLLADHDELCNDMEMLTNQIHKRVFEKSESLHESDWLDLVVELSKERDTPDMWKISSIATNFLRYAHSSPEVGAALGNLVEFSRRHGAFLYHHEPTGTMTYQWLPGMNPVLRKNASRKAH